MGIITYDQDTSHLHNEDGDFIGRIYKEGDGLGHLIEERVDGWLSLSKECDQLRKQVRILREALERFSFLVPPETKDCGVLDVVLLVALANEARSSLEATKEP